MMLRPAQDMIWAIENRKGDIIVPSHKYKTPKITVYNDHGS